MRSWEEIVVRINGVELTGRQKDIWIIHQERKLWLTTSLQSSIAEAKKSFGKVGLAMGFTGTAVRELAESIRASDTHNQWLEHYYAKEDIEESMRQSSLQGLQVDWAKVTLDDAQEEQKWKEIPLQYIPPPNFSRNPEHTRLRHYGSKFSNSKKPPHRTTRNNL